MAFGRLNRVKVDPLAYNIGLIGESGVGKTTVINEMLLKLNNNNPQAALFIETGHEDGADAIDGINSINCPEWSMDYDEATNSAGFEDVIDDILENKSTEYPDLRTVVVDTYDNLVKICEPYVVRLHNKLNPEKKVNTINSAFGGFGKGDDKIDELILEKLWDLKKVGVSFIIIGHTKVRDIVDATNGETYSQLTTNMSMKHFNAIKTKLHFLGVATLDREFIKKKSGQKDLKKKDVLKNVISKEARKITFRSDDYSVDSKSRFAEITPEINLDADELIKAITNAIKAEQSKSGKSFEETKKEQDQAREQREEEIAQMLKAEKEKKDLEAVNEEIYQFIVDKKDDKTAILPILKALKEHGLTSPKDITDMSLAKEILKLTK